MKQNETMFFCLLDSGKQLHDRIQVFINEEKSLRDLFNWIQDQREELEAATKRDVLIRDFKIINTVTD